MLYLIVAAACAACHDRPPPPAAAPANAAPPQPPPEKPLPQKVPPPATEDAALAGEREEFIQDAMVFTGITHDKIVVLMTEPTPGMKDEWTEWEKQGPMTDDRIKKFYKQTKNYIWDLGAWHLNVLDKRQSDLALVDQIKQAHPTNVLDFGGGVGMNALMIARAGVDVTLADLDSQTLAFGMLRAKRHDVKLKFWKSDVEPMPPDAKYDIILCLDVLEHLPQAELKTTVDKLIKLKKPTTQIVISAPFGRTATHPMHLDATAETVNQIRRLRTELPKD